MYEKLLLIWCKRTGTLYTYYAIDYLRTQLYVPVQWTGTSTSKRAGRSPLPAPPGVNVTGTRL